MVHPANYARNLLFFPGVCTSVRIRSAIIGAILLVPTVAFIGCNREPEINGTFDVSFFWRDGTLQRATVGPVERTLAPSMLQKQVLVKLSEPFISDHIRAANLGAATGVIRLFVLGSPPYFVEVRSLTITEPDFSELWAAVEGEDIDKIQALVRRYGNVNQRGLPSRQTALAIAAAGRHDASLKTLLRLGADVNAADYIGVTPLMDAVMADSPAAVRMLVACGANITQTSKVGDSAYSLAQHLHRDQIAHLFQENRPTVSPCVR